MFFYTHSHFETIEKYSKYFDKKTNLLYSNEYNTKYLYEILLSYKIPYNNKTKMHHIEESAEYALKLLMQPTLENTKRAKDILSVILKLQVSDPQNPNYGIFPTYLEYPADKPGTPMYVETSVVITLYLIQILINFKNLIPASMIKKIEKACHLSIFYISNSEIKIGYAASIHSLIDAAVLLACGTIFKKSEYLHLGMKKFDNYYTALKYNGSFWEHNSPCEMYFISSALEFIRTTITDNQCNYIIDNLNNMLWENIAINFHASINKLTGPCSNAARTTLDEVFLHFINRNIRNNNKTKDNIMINDTLRCPTKYRILLDNPTPNHFHRTQVSEGCTSHFFILDHIASNYLQPEYTVGSFNKEEFWANHSPFNGYIKSDENEPPYQFKIRVLNNGHDFASAELHAIQEKGFVLGHIFFNTNRGNVHLVIDNIKGRIVTSDFRIRFEITGNINNLDVKTKNKSLTVSYGSVNLTYKIPFAEFDNISIKNSIIKTETHLFFDTYLDIPENFELNFAELEKAIYQFSFLISSSAKTMNDVENSFENGFMISETEHENHYLRIKTPYKPSTYEYTNAQSKEYINKLTLTHYVSLNEQKSMQYEFIANSSFTTPALDIESGDYFANIKKISDGPTEKLSDIIKETLNDMLKNNYNHKLFQRYSIHVISAFFERMENEDIRYKKLIDTNYYDIYHKISTSLDNENTTKIINKTVQNLYNDFSVMQEKFQMSSTIQNVISIIDENYHNPDLSISMISEMLGMNASFISREFKNKTGTNYLKYLTSVRIEKAKELLLTDTPLSEVSIACGYIYLSNFRHTFKRHTGITISEWLNKQKGVK